MAEAKRLEEAKLRLERERREEADRRERQRQWQLEEDRRAAERQAVAHQAWLDEQSRLKVIQDEKDRKHAKRKAFWSGVRRFFRTVFTIIVLSAVTWLCIMISTALKARAAADERKAAEARERETEQVKRNIRDLEDRLKEL